MKRQPLCARQSRSHSRSVAREYAHARGTEYFLLAQAGPIPTAVPEVRALSTTDRADVDGHDDDPDATTRIVHNQPT